VCVCVTAFLQHIVMYQYTVYAIFAFINMTYTQIGTGTAGDHASLCAKLAFKAFLK